MAGLTGQQHQEEDVLSDYKGGWKAVETSFKATGERDSCCWAILTCGMPVTVLKEGMNKKGILFFYRRHDPATHRIHSIPVLNLKRIRNWLISRMTGYTEHSHVWKTKKAVSEWLQEERDTLLMPSGLFRYQ